ncbi:helix-turn-helix domain-containing protein [Novosphingobium barchaimii]|uniref:helix-turn-helix domain-containing protein n=1 Tax=Novosphingobium barchaimii TaxID=1420591 RepID=UPI0007412D84|nr:helix-turn-helix domain-containing protein [Novosphingobium barchaimii]
MTRLLTAEQVCQQFGIPSTRTLRTMRQKGLTAVRLGKAFLFDESDVTKFIEKQKTCQDPTEGRVSIGSQIDRPSTFSGTSVGRSAFGQLARQTAAKLKQPSRNSSGQVISISGRENPGK